MPRSGRHQLIMMMMIHDEVKLQKTSKAAPARSYIMVLYYFERPKFNKIAFKAGMF